MFIFHHQFDNEKFIYLFSSLFSKKIYLSFNSKSPHHISVILRIDCWKKEKPICKLIKMSCKKQVTLVKH